MVALPARAERHSVRHSKPLLRVLAGGLADARSRKRMTASPRCESWCRKTFHVAAAVLLCVFGLGMARVILTVEATEAAVLSATLSESVDEELIVNERLQTYYSALTAPPRIRALAEGSLGMSLASDVDFLVIEQPSTRDHDAMDGPIVHAPAFDLAVLVGGLARHIDALGGSGIGVGTVGSADAARHLSLR